MNSYSLERFESDAALGNAAAERFLERIAAARSGKPFTVALSGGRIAKRFFTAAAEQARARRASFDSVHFLWGDERCVPPTDPESNFRIPEELLFKPLEIPNRQIHRIRGEVAPDIAAMEAAEELSRITGVERGSQPVIDLVLLGMGEDGHVASLFPGESAEAASSPAIYRPVVASKPPPERITLGYATIVAASEVWVLASGAGKESALKESLRQGGNTPLAQVLRMRSNTTILTDIPQWKFGGGQSPPAL